MTVILAAHPADDKGRRAPTISPSCRSFAETASKSARSRETGTPHGCRHVFHTARAGETDSAKQTSARLPSATVVTRFKGKAAVWVHFVPDATPSCSVPLSVNAGREASCADALEPRDRCQQ